MHRQQYLLCLHDCPDRPNLVKILEKYIKFKTRQACRKKLFKKVYHLKLNEYIPKKEKNYLLVKALRMLILIISS